MMYSSPIQTGGKETARMVSVQLGNSPDVAEAHYIKPNKEERG
jgi:hypothetical protein